MNTGSGRWRVASNSAASAVLSDSSSRKITTKTVNPSSRAWVTGL
jgi:hypothetical protein